MMNVYDREGAKKIRLQEFVQIKQTEVNMGTVPTQSKTFTVVDSSITSTAYIIANHSGDAATGKAEDENEMDVLVCRAAAGSGQFTLYVDSLTGPVVGNFKINYVSIG